MDRLAVLGLDAMHWRYFDKLFQHGIMPYTRTMAERSFTATLEAYPPATPPSWSSIMTGVNPGKHGIFDFFRYRRNGWEQSLYTALDLKHPRVHEMLSFLGIKSIVFNPIPDHPIIPVKNSEVISNLFFVWKPIAKPEESLNRYFRNENPLSYIGDATCNILSKYRKVLELYEGAIEHALESDAKLLWVNLNIPDIFFHRCPEILNPRVLLKEEGVLFDRLDRVIRRLDENYDHLIIVSDHGFSSYNKVVSINDILVENGLATSSSQRTVEELGEYRIKKGLAKIENVEEVTIPLWAYKLIKKLGLSGLGRKFVRYYSALRGKKVIVSTSKYVDVRNSKAFLPSAHSFGIYTKREEDKKSVLQMLERYRDMIEFYPAEKFYSGPYIHDAPDIVVFPRFDDGFWIVGNQIIGAPYVEGKRYAHHPHGVLIVRSDLIRPYKTRKAVPNYSVASIAMALMRKPLPKLRDIPKTLEDELYGKVEELNYEVRWRVMGRSRRLRMGR